MRTWALSVVVGLLVLSPLVSGTALAGPDSEAELEKKADLVRSKARSPIRAADLRRTPLQLDRYHNEVTIVRKRSARKEFATFVAEPKLLQRGSFILFEIRSVAKTGVISRWRCIATADVAECLGRPVKVRYLPRDEEIVLTAKLMPISELTPRYASR